LGLANATGLPAAGVTGTALTLAGGNLTGVLGLTAGTALLPAIIPTGDPNTGVWFPAADTVAVSTGGAERMRIDSAGSVGIGGTAPTGVNLYNVKSLSGATSAWGTYTLANVTSGVTANALLYDAAATTEAAAFTLSNLFCYRATQGAFGATSAVTNQYGFHATSSLIGATNNYGFYGNLASAANRYNFYAAGTADNAYAGNSSFGQVVAPIAAVDTTSFATNLVTNTAANYTVLTSDHTIIQTTAGSTYTLPAAASFTGRKLHLVTQFAGTVISASSNVVPLAGGAAGTAILAATAGKFATLQSNGTNWIIIASN
jgi:hypothetical protein